MLSQAREWYSGSTSASQAEDGGSIPLSRSKVRPSARLNGNRNFSHSRIWRIGGPRANLYVIFYRCRNSIVRTVAHLSKQTAPDVWIDQGDKGNVPSCIELEPSRTLRLVLVHDGVVFDAPRRQDSCVLRAGYQIVWIPAPCSRRSRVTSGTPRCNAVAAMMRSGMSATMSRGNVS